MVFVKKMFKRIVFLIVLTSLLISFMSMPQSYAKLELEDGEFYYSGTTEGEYVVKPSVFSWLLDMIGQIADYLIGIMTMMVRMVFVGWTALFEKLLTKVMESTMGMGLEGTGNTIDTSEVTDELSKVNVNDEDKVEQSQKNIDGKAIINETKWTDPSNNITVQAIVFNKVPAFNINFFKSEEDFLKDVTGTTGTGRSLYCMGKDCKVNGYPKKCSECCGEDGSTIGQCGCGPAEGIPCANCRRYVQNLERIKNTVNSDNKPAILVVREAVATWYYVLRLLSIAAMLVALIVIGVKMALSTIASDKAVYKRMLVDWIAGMVIVFSIHYVMIFIINLNDILVSTIEKASNKIHAVQFQEMNDPLHGDFEDGLVRKSNEDLELNIYEMIRTRAYDPKLTVGLTGMIMYMTLVYFAIRYTIVYFKRYFTIAMLTLVGPPLGVAYALQRTLTGKSSSLKLWFTEYLTNVIIQTVHALIYGIFIGSALVLSIKSISGMLVALILMNFALKADKLFRRIFKFGNGGGLAESTAEAGSAENMKNMIQKGISTYMGAKPALHMLSNTPYAKAVKGAAKFTSANVGYGVAKASQAFENRVMHDDNAIDRHMDRHYGGSEYTDSDNEDEEAVARKENKREEAKEDYYNTRRGKVRLALQKKIQAKNAELDDDVGTPIKVLDAIGKKGLEKRVKDAQARVDILENKGGKEEKAAAQRYLERTKADLDKYNIFNPSTGEIISSRLEDMAEKQSPVKKVKEAFKFERAKVDIEEGDSKVYKAVERSRANLSAIKAAGQAITGTYTKDRYGLSKSRNRDSVYDSTTMFAAMGLTPDDIKDIKSQAINPLMKIARADFQMLAGVATITAHPGVGAALLATGSSTRKKALASKKGYKPYRGRYTAARYGTETLNRMQNEAFATEQRVKNNMFSQLLREKHPELVSKLSSNYSRVNLMREGRMIANTEEINRTKNNVGNVAPDITFGTLGTAAAVEGNMPAIGVVGGAVAGAAVGRIVGNSYRNSGLASNIVELTRKAEKKNRELRDTIRQENGEKQGKKIIEEQKVFAEHREDFYKHNKKIEAEDLGAALVFETMMADYKNSIANDNLNDSATEGDKVSEPKLISNNIEVSTSKNKTKVIKFGDETIKEINKELDAAIDIIIKSKSTPEEDYEVDIDKDGKEIAKILEKALLTKGIITKGQHLYSEKGITDKNIVNAIKRKTAFTKAKNNAVNKIAQEKLLEIVSVTDPSLSTFIKKPDGENPASESSGTPAPIQARPVKAIVHDLEQERKSLVSKKANLRKGLDSLSKAEVIDKRKENIECVLKAAKKYATMSTSIDLDTKSKKDMLSNFSESEAEKRREKLSKIQNLDVTLSEMVEDPDESNRRLYKNKKVEMTSTDDVIAHIKEIAKQEELTPYDTDEALRLLFSRKELESINADGIDGLNKKNFSKDYKKAQSEASGKKVKYLQAKESVLRFEEDKKKADTAWEEYKSANGERLELQRKYEEIRSKSGKSGNTPITPADFASPEEKRDFELFESVYRQKKQYEEMGSMVDKNGRLIEGPKEKLDRIKREERSEIAYKRAKKTSEASGPIINISKLQSKVYKKS